MKLLLRFAALRRKGNEKVYIYKKNSNYFCCSVFTKEKKNVNERWTIKPSLRLWSSRGSDIRSISLSRIVIRPSTY